MIGRPHGLHGPYPRLVTGLGVGVHRTRFRSFSFAVVPSHPALRPITSARLAAAVPSVERSSSLFAAGVSAPAASARLGVHEGGPMSPFFPPPGAASDARARAEPMRFALVRSDRDAAEESLCESASREVGARMWNGVFGGGRDVSAGSSLCERMRGVPISVPMVMSCFTASGPSSEGVGEGKAGTYEKLLIPGDLGRSSKCR